MGPVQHFVQGSFLRLRVVSPSPNPQTGGPPLVGCPQLIIRYIRSYPPHWKPSANPKTCHAQVSETSLNMIHPTSTS